MAVVYMIQSLNKQLMIVLLEILLKHEILTVVEKVINEKLLSENKVFLTIRDYNY